MIHLHSTITGIPSLTEIVNSSPERRTEIGHPEK